MLLVEHCPAGETRLRQLIVPSFNSSPTMGKRKGSKKRRRPEEDGSSRVRRRARPVVSRWSDGIEQAEPEHEEAGPSRQPDEYLVQRLLLLPGAPPIIRHCSVDLGRWLTALGPSNHG